MNRRRALAWLAACAAAQAAGAVRAAEGAKHVAGVSLAPLPRFKWRADALRRALAQAGMTEPAHVRFTWLSAEGRNEGLEAVAQQAVAAKPDVLVAANTIVARALLQATASIPIVAASTEDPVASRLVRALDHPGGNLTGLVTSRPDETLRATQLLARLLPRGAVVGALLNQNNATYRLVRSRVHYVAQQEGLTPVYLDANGPAELARIFAGLGRERVAGLVVMDDAAFLDERERIVKLANASRRPAIYPDRAYVAVGGLMSYGGDAAAAMARTAAIVKRILDGTHPADIPFEPAPPFTLVINRATARAQKVALPSELTDKATFVG